MDMAQLAVAILSTAGGGGALLYLVKGISKWLSGAAGRERAKDATLESQRLAAINERIEADNRADVEVERRRQADEYASKLRLLLIEAGKIPPPWYHDSNEKKEKTDVK